MPGVPVAFIAGSSFSGSTLLGLILGGTPGVVYCGEINQYRRSAWRNRPAHCTCGSAYLACPLWSRVYADLSDGRDLNPSPGFSLANLRLLLSILVPRGWSATRKTTDYTAVIDAIRRHVTSGTGECPWIVDSSKSLDALNALSRSPRIDLRVIHLVRDGRGVAISFLKRGRNPLAALAAWMSVNALLFLYIRRHGIPCLRVDYRSLCEDGPATVAEIRRLLGLEGVPRDAIQLGPRHSYHLMEGNRKIRDLASGEREFVGLRYHGDTSGLSRRERVVARLVTDPLYKFLVSGRKLARERVLIR